MSSVLEMLKAKKDAEAAASLAAATELAQLPKDPTIGTFVEPDAAVTVVAEVPVELPKGPPGSYRAKRLQRFFLKNGVKVEPNEDGFFIPQSEEEATELAYFSQLYDMVEFQDEAPAA